MMSVGLSKTHFSQDIRGARFFPTYRLLVFIISAGLHVSIILLCTSTAHSFAAVTAIDIQILALVAMVLSLIPIIPKLGKLVVVFLGVRLLLYVVIAGHLAGEPLIGGLLIGTFLFDAAMYFSIPWNIVVVGGVLTAVIIKEAAVKTLDPNIMDLPLAALLIVPAIIAGLSIPLRHCLDCLVEVRSHVQSLNDAVIQLTDANSGFLRYASTAEKKSADQERRRITRELHDIIGQTLTDIIAMMDAVVRNPMESREELCKLHQWVRYESQRCLQETREILYRLRSMPDVAMSGSAAIQNLIRTFGYSTGIKVRLDWANSPADFGERLNTVFYRVIQESLVNAFRHGRASRVWILFWMDSDSIVVSIEDNGNGSGTGKQGIGQTGMEERVRDAGGTISFRSSELGYIVRVVCPRIFIGYNETLTRITG